MDQIKTENQKLQQRVQFLEEQCKKYEVRIQVLEDKLATNSTSEKVESSATQIDG
jgi:phage shock protein A